MTEAVTVVIPHYRADVLYDCVASVYAHSDYPVCVLVVDDGGNAPSLQRAKAAFPALEVLPNERNLGFAAACNRGLAATQTRYAVLLNDDTRVEPNWLAPLVAMADSDSQNRRLPAQAALGQRARPLRLRRRSRRLYRRLGLRLLSGAALRPL